MVPTVTFHSAACKEAHEMRPTIACSRYIGTGIRLNLSLSTSELIGPPSDELLPRVFCDTRSKAATHISLDGESLQMTS